MYHNIKHYVGSISRRVSLRCIIHIIQYTTLYWFEYRLMFGLMVDIMSCLFFDVTNAPRFYTDTSSIHTTYIYIYSYIARFICTREYYFVNDKNIA